MESLWNEIQDVKSKIKDFYFVKGATIPGKGSYKIPYSCGSNTSYFGFIVSQRADRWEDGRSRNDNLPMVYPKKGNWSQSFKYINSGVDKTFTISCSDGTLSNNDYYGATAYLIVTNSTL